MQNHPTNEVVWHLDDDDLPQCEVSRERACQTEYVTAKDVVIKVGDNNVLGAENRHSIKF